VTFVFVCAVLFVPLSTFEVVGVTKDRENGRAVYKIMLRETTVSQTLHSMLSQFEAKLQAH
jgi:hypothetical protein